MSPKAAITVMRPRSEIERLWRESAFRAEQADGGATVVRFVDAPGDRGTEIHVELQGSATAGKVGEVVRKLLGREPLAKVKDGLRHFKQQVETGSIARSEASPEGERLERKFKERPAQPLDPSERERVVA